MAQTERQIAQHEDQARLDEAVANLRNKIAHKLRRNGWGTVTLTVKCEGGRVTKGGIAVAETETN